LLQILLSSNMQELRCLHFFIAPTTVIYTHLLLGLYLYEYNQKIREQLISFKKQVGEKDESEHNGFFLRWFVAAIFHDIGYIAENTAGNDSFNAYRDVQKELLSEYNNLISYPLSKVGEFADILKEGQEKTRSSKLPFNIEHNHIAQFNEIWKDRDGKDVFEPFDSLSHNMGVGILKSDSGSILTRYFDLACKTAPNADKDSKRAPFLDHGIVSSALLLRNYQNYTERIEHVSKLDIFRGEKSELITSIEITKEAYQSVIYDAASAIAFHNLGILWEHSTYEGYGLFPSNKMIIRFEKDTALIFYLWYIDSLQDWDRPLYRYRKEEDHYSFLSDIDLLIRPENNKICIAFRSDFQRPDPTTDKRARFYNTKKKLGKILELKSIPYLFEYCTDLNQEFDPEPSKHSTSSFDYESFDYESFFANEELMNKIKILFDKHTDFKKLDLHLCQYGKDTPCRYHYQTILFIAELYRNLEALGETVRFLDYMGKLMTQLIKLQSLESELHFKDVRDLFDKVIRTILNDIITFFNELDRDYKINWGKKEDRNDEIVIFKKRAEKFMQLRLSNANIEDINDFINSIETLYRYKRKGLSLLPPEEFKKTFIEELKDPIENLKAIWQDSLSPYFRSTRDIRIDEVVKTISINSDKFKKLNITELNNEEGNLQFPHYSNGNKYRIWKTIPETD